MQEKSKQTSLPLEYRANHLVLQEKRKEHQTTDGSGEKLLELLPKQNLPGVFFENVEGIINIEGGKVLQQIQKDLETEGFKVQCLIIPKASGVGAWHQRKRVWIIGYNVSNSNVSRSLKEYNTSVNRQDKRNGSVNESGSRSDENVSNSKSKKNQVEQQKVMAEV